MFVLCSFVFVVAQEVISRFTPVLCAVNRVQTCAIDKKYTQFILTAKTKVLTLWTCKNFYSVSFTTEIDIMVASMDCIKSH